MSQKATVGRIGISQVPQPPEGTAQMIRSGNLFPHRLVKTPKQTVTLVTQQTLQKLPLSTKVVNS